MAKKPKAVLMGPFVGELYWETARFAPMLPNMVNKEYRGKDIKFIILTRKDRFDLYGKFADILVPLRIPGDYKEQRQPNCFRLNGLKVKKYLEIVRDFHTKYKERYHIIKHIYPDVTQKKFLNKDQFPQKKMHYIFNPRQENYDIVNDYLPKNGKPLVALAPRYRNGFRRNWNSWPEFYDRLSNDKELIEDFNFIVCGKEGEYISDQKNRFLDLNDMTSGDKSSLVGLLLVVLENTFFTFGSQSAIPNMSLLYNIEVLEFGCQKTLHTRTYNVKNTPITFIVNKKYNIPPREIFPQFKKLLYKKRRKENASNKKRLDSNEKA
jgi:hypothetical protein